MPEDDAAHPRRASLEVLRAEAADELAVVVYERLRHGEDPWAFMDELPTVDELVVLTLRAEAIGARGGVVPDAREHYRMLRAIAISYPALTETVWRLVDATNTHRAWDAVVRVEA